MKSNESYLQKLPGYTDINNVTSLGMSVEQGAKMADETTQERLAYYAPFETPSLDPKATQGY
jgi:hypothetical protein